MRSNIDSLTTDQLLREISSFVNMQEQLNQLDTFKKVDTFRRACGTGNLKMVQYLYDLFKEDINNLMPNKANAIQLACMTGHLEIVKFLCGLTGSDPTANDNRAIGFAIQNRRFNIVNYLKELPGVNFPAKEEIENLKEAQGLDANTQSPKDDRYKLFRGVSVSGNVGNVSSSSFCAYNVPKEKTEEVLEHMKKMAEKIDYLDQSIHIAEGSTVHGTVGNQFMNFSFS